MSLRKVFERLIVQLSIKCLLKTLLELEKIDFLDIWKIILVQKIFCTILYGV